MEKERKNSYSAEKTAEQNVRAGYRKSGSYFGAAKSLNKLLNVTKKHTKARRKFRSSTLLALHKKAKQVAHGTHKTDRYEKEYRSHERKEKGEHRKVMEALPVEASGL